MENFLFQATIYLAAAVLAVPLATRAGLGSVLGYLLAGIVIGPILGLVGSETEDLQHFAEFGVVLMLFLIGLELEPRALWDMRHKLLGLGGLQVVITLGAVTLGALALGQPLPTAIAIGMILSLSSTAIVLQTLSEKSLMQTQGGRASFSVLLTQDIAVIPMLILLPFLAAPAMRDAGSSGTQGHGGEAASTAEGAGAAAAEAAMSLIESLPAWGIALATLSAVALIILIGVFAIGPLFHFVYRTRLRELNTALALLIVVGIASIMFVVGLSPALGTFLAGVVLANSEFRHELESDIEPFKGLLLGLFFITVGAGIDFRVLFGAPVTIIGLTLGLMAVKGAILYFLARMFGLFRRDRWLFTLGLAQAGEFGFVLTSFGLQLAVLPGGLSQTVLLVVALSMLLTPLFFIVWERVTARMTEEAEAPDEDEIDERQPIIIAGLGRFGQVVNRMLELSGFHTVMLDHDLETIRTMRRFGFKGFYGDPTRPELLHAAGLREAKVLVVSLDDREAAVRLVRFARSERPDLHIVARARDRVHVYELYRAGADDIVREMFDSSLRAGRYVLEKMGLSDYEAAQTERTFFRMDRRAVRELAELWRPGVPVSENEEYVARARELNTELETALVTQLDDHLDLDDLDDLDMPPDRQKRRAAGE
jgi:CPA2 family monovalent cation:H+ antiporter-2